MNRLEVIFGRACAIDILSKDKAGVNVPDLPKGAGEASVANLDKVFYCFTSNLLAQKLNKYARNDGEF